MTDNALPSPEQLRQLLAYDPATGQIVWLPRDVSTFAKPRFGKTWNTRFAGRSAGAVGGHGYLYVEVLGSNPIGAHRIAWAITHGRWPSVIDHINGDVSDNRLENLREVTTLENQRNMRRGRDNTSGHVGVSRSRRGWRAYISVAGKQIFLGSFQNIDDAVAERKAAEKRFGFHENHGR